jgi:hypothetical protein
VVGIIPEEEHCNRKLYAGRRFKIACPPLLLTLILVQRLNKSALLSGSGSEILLSLVFANNTGRVFILDNQPVLPKAPFDISFGYGFIDYLDFFIAGGMTTESALGFAAVIIPGCIHIIVFLESIALTADVFISMMPVGASTIVANIRLIDDKTLLVSRFHFINKFVEP